MIIASASVTMTLRTLCEYATELTGMAHDLNEQQELHQLWLELQTMDPSDELYSDLYKEVYGFRPR